MSEKDTDINEKILLEVKHTKVVRLYDGLLEVDKEEWESMSYSEKEMYVSEYRDEGDFIKHKAYTDDEEYESEWDELDVNSTYDQQTIESYEEDDR